MEINNILLREYLFEKKLISKGDSIEFKEIGRGAFNVNYLIKTNNREKFLFRFIIWSMRDNIQNMAKYESLVLNNLKWLGISPKIILTDDTRNFFSYLLIIEEYIEGKTMKENKRQYIEQVIDSLPIVIKMHQKGNVDRILPQSKIISKDLFNRKLECLKKYNSPYIRIIGLHKNSIDKFISRCNKLLDGKVFIHGDLNPENFIFSNSKKWYLVDWQSSFMGDASFDIATLLWDFEWNFFTGKPLSLKQKNLIKERYCALSKTNIVELERKIDIVTVFLDLDMVTRIEYLFMKLTNESDLLKIENAEKDFILKNRVSPARALLVNKKNLLEILKKIESFVN